MIDLWNYGTVLMGLIIIILIFIYKKSNVSNYWDLQGVPNIKPSIFGDFMQRILIPMQDLEMHLYKKYGRIYGRYDGTIPVLTVGDPEILKYILVKDFNAFQNRRNVQLGDPIMDNNISLVNGEDWKRIRNFVTPTFTSAKLKQMMNKMYVCTDTLITELEKSEGSKSSIEFKRLTDAFVMDVIASCVFGIKLMSLEDPQNPFIVNALNFLTSGLSFRSIFAVYLPWLMKLFSISIFNTTSVDFFRKFTMQRMKEHMESDQPHADILYLLMKARENAESSSHVTENKTVYQNGKSESKHQSKSLSETELIAHCVTFFLAGFESVTTLVCFTLANLAANKEIQNKLWTEINTTIKEKEKPDYDDLMNMSYLDAIISESLRMSSAAIRIDRTAENNYTIAKSGIQIKKGQLISVPIYSIHYDPEWYPNPQNFDPERFTAEAKSERNPFTYLPFGLGPRSCIGKRFALLEAKLLLIMVIKKFEISLAPETKFPLKFISKQGLLIVNDVYLTIKAREENC